MPDELIGNEKEECVKYNGLERATFRCRMRRKRGSTRADS
jgi:hypothetical protein